MSEMKKIKGKDALSRSGTLSVESYIATCKRESFTPTFEDFASQIAEMAQNASATMQPGKVAMASFAAGYAYAVWESEQKGKMP